MAYGQYVAALALCLATITAQATLVGRFALTPGGTDYQAYYDDVLNITWLTDASYAQTSGYDADGRMSWSAAQGWIATLNAANHLGTNNWRLPAVTDTGGPGCSGNTYTGGDCGFNVTTSEMAGMFYSTLGNTGFYNTNGTPTGCSDTSPYCLTNEGPFSNLQPYFYWSDTEYAPNTSIAWFFNFSSGLQNYDPKFNEFYAWAVSPGDLLAVPVPPGVLLFGSAIGLMGWVRRIAS